MSDTTCDWQDCERGREPGMLFCAEHLGSEIDRWLADSGYPGRVSDDTAMTRERAVHLLTHDAESGEYTGDLRVLCSRWGSTGAECAEVAYDLDRTIAEAGGDPITRESLDAAMSLVVNDHEGVGSVLYSHGDEAVRERYEDELTDWVPRVALSSNHYSTDIQLSDVVGLMPADVRAAFDAEHPEWESLTWSGSWVDYKASGVDMEYTSWAIDWVESHTNVMWDDGEPYAYAAMWATDDPDITLV